MQWKAVGAICGWMALVMGAFAALGEPRQVPDPGWVTNARYVRQMDGDTAVFAVTMQLRIRFLDCWCGELKAKDPVEKKLGKLADEYLAELVRENPGVWTVEIPAKKMRDGDIADLNTMGRWLGYVYLPDGRCVNDLRFRRVDRCRPRCRVNVTRTRILRVFRHIPNLSPAY